MSETGRPAPPGWDTSSDERFFDYYAAQSEGPVTVARYRAIRDMVLRVLRRESRPAERLEIADVGCGAGTQCMLWAELGHRVHGLDINEPLLQLARERAAASGHAIDFHIGTAVDLPWAAGSMDVCLVPELLEHVADWESCIAEFARVLRGGGLLFVSTTNKLCPLQLEFNLPLYSWYPARLKRRFERLASTTRPELANFATYPAVNWFTFYSLRRHLAGLGFRSLDRFDVMDLEHKGRVARGVVRTLRALPPLRWLGHVATPATLVVALKHDRGPGA